MLLTKQLTVVVYMLWGGGTMEVSVWLPTFFKISQEKETCTSLEQVKGEWWPKTYFCVNYPFKNNCMCCSHVNPMKNLFTQIECDY